MWVTLDATLLRAAFTKTVIEAKYGQNVCLPGMDARRKAMHDTNT